MPGLSQTSTGAGGTRNITSVLSTNGSTSTVSGTIYAGPASEMNVNAGSGCGYVNVYTNSSTQWTYNGYSVASGTPITFTATGSCGTSFTASSVSLGSSSTPNLTGTIYAVSGKTINVKGGADCGYVNVTYGSSTTMNYNGNSLASGVPISVWGSGSCASSYSASTVSLGSGGSSSISQTHVLTSDYLAGYAGTSSVSWSSAATVLSWAEVPTDDANAISAAGMKILSYVAPFEQATTDPLYSSDESTFSHSCTGARISVPYESGQWLMNPGSSDLESKMNTWQDSEESQGHIDAFFYDNIDDLYGLTILPCDATQSSWDAENATFISSSAHPIVFNGYGMNSDAEALINNSKVIGGMLEDCYGERVGSTTPYQTASGWVSNEDHELYAANAGKMFFCYNTPISAASSSIALREYIYASFLISFSPSSSVLWEYFSTPSGLHVFPESKLVPMDPLVSEASSVSSYLSSTGVYVREYADCYVAGQNVGRCAAIVNSDTTSHSKPSLSQSYSHTMTISGNGILDGGSLSVTGAAAPSTIPEETGYVLTQ